MEKTEEVKQQSPTSDYEEVDYEKAMCEDVDNNSSHRIYQPDDCPHEIYPSDSEESNEEEYDIIKNAEECVEYLEGTIKDIKLLIQLEKKGIRSLIDAMLTLKHE